MYRMEKVQLLALSAGAEATAPVGELGIVYSVDGVYEVGTGTSITRRCRDKICVIVYQARARTLATTAVIYLPPTNSIYIRYVYLVNTVRYVYIWGVLSIYVCIYIKMCNIAMEQCNVSTILIYCSYLQYIQLYMVHPRIRLKVDPHIQHMQGAQQRNRHGSEITNRPKYLTYVSVRPR